MQQTKIMCLRWGGKHSGFICWKPSLNAWVLLLPAVICPPCFCISRPSVFVSSNRVWIYTKSLIKCTFKSRNITGKFCLLFPVLRAYTVRNTAKASSLRPTVIRNLGLSGIKINIIPLTKDGMSHTSRNKFQGRSTKICWQTCI